MQRLTRTMLAGFTAALFGAFLSATPARADDFLHRITINFSPVYLFSTGDDDVGPPFPGQAAVGYTKDNPTVGGVRFDYGGALQIDPRLSLSFQHSNIGYQLGRILTAIPNTSLVTGSIYDYTDTIALSYTVGGGLGLQGTYFDHQRSVVTGLCLNQKYCYDTTTQSEISNPQSIDEHGYTLGFTYDFGPTTKIGKLFTAAASAKYVPRPDTPAPGAALGGLGSYVGTQTLFPYSLTMKLPITNSTTFTPFINYTNLPVLYRDSAVPEAYRGIIFGFSKVISKNLTLSYTNINLKSCTCIARVPPPDNLRLAAGILQLNIHTGL